MRARVVPEVATEQVGVIKAECGANKNRGTGGDCFRNVSLEFSVRGTCSIGETRLGKQWDCPRFGARPISLFGDEVTAKRFRCLALITT